MKEYKGIKGFSFNQNKLCLVVISFLFLIFSSQVFGSSVEGIICVGPTDVGDTASEGGTNPCNLHASVAERDVPVAQHVAQLEGQSDVSSEGTDESSQPKNEGAEGVQ